MKQITIKIQSFTDVITNSSSELFIISTNLSEDTFKDIWINALKMFNYDLNDETYMGEIREEDNKIEINFPIMCNLDNNIYEWLDFTFGKDNIKIQSW